MSPGKHKGGEYLPWRARPGRCRRCDEPCPPEKKSRRGLCPTCQAEVLAGHHANEQKAGKPPKLPGE